MEGTERPRPYGSATVQVCKNIHKKKKREKKGDSESEKVKRKRRENTRMPFSPPPVWRYEEGDVCHTPHRERMIWPGRRSSTSKTRSCPSTRWSHVELHVLDMPFTWEADQVIGLSPCDLLVPHKDRPCCWVINESRSSAGPSPDSAIRTSHPRLRMVHPPPSSSAPGSHQNRSHPFQEPTMSLPPATMEPPVDNEGSQEGGMLMEDDAMGVMSIF